MTEDSEQTLQENNDRSNSSIRRSNTSSSRTTNHSSTHSGSNRSEKRDRTRDGLQTRVVIRHLPPTMSSEQFLEEISPIPEYNDYYLMRADTSLGIHSFSRAYINFIHMEDVFIFKERFDNYVFIDSKGNEFTAIVEFAPFQRIPRRRIGANGQPITAKKRDNKCGTIEQDSDYLTFLEDLEKGKHETNMPSAEVYLEEIEAREKELRANRGVPKVITPLIEFIRNKKAEKLRLREERREERRKQLQEQKRIKEEEHQRKLKQLKKYEDNRKIKESDEHSKDKSHKKEDERIKIKSRDSERRESNKSIEINKKSEYKKNEKKSSYSTSSKSNRYGNERTKDTSNTVSNSGNNESTFVVKVLHNPEKDKEKTNELNSSDNSDLKKSETIADKNMSQELKEVSSEQKRNTDSKSEKTDNSSKASYESSSRADSKRIRNKDRPAREIYKPGSAVKRSGSDSKTQSNNDSHTSGVQKSSTNRSEHGYKNRVFTRSKHND